MSEKFTCPRRIEDGAMLAYGGENSDTWGKRADKRLHCSYCGSVKPDEFIAYLKEGGELGVTDKNYKAYLGRSDGGKFYYQHLSVEQRHDFIDLLNEKKVNFGYPGFFTVLPYFTKIAP
jgi:hypothetical protein